MAKSKSGDPRSGQKKEGSGKAAVAVIIAILAVLVAVMALEQFGIIRFPWNPEPAKVSNVGGSIKQGSPGDDAPQATEAPGISVSINGRPVFENGSAAGNLNIINPEKNSYVMRYVLSLDELDEAGDRIQIYDSGFMQPNTYIDNDKLSVTLSKGEYNVTADIQAYNPDDLETLVNRVAASLILTIEN